MSMKPVRSNPKLTGFLVMWLAVWVVSASSAFAGSLSVISDEPLGNPTSESSTKVGEGEGEPLPEETEIGVTPEALPDPQGRESQAADKPAVDPLQVAAQQEEQLLIPVVQLLDGDEAARWLGSFISAAPLNCPIRMRDKWIDAIVYAVRENDIPLCKEILGLTACIIAIESGFQADPLAVDPSGGETMADLLRRAELELSHKMGPLLSIPPVPNLYLRYKSRFFPMILQCRTEGDVEKVAGRIADDLTKDAAGLPQMVRDVIQREIHKVRDVVKTKGSMQLNFVRAQEVMKKAGRNMSDKELCDYMYTLRGGVHVGMAALRPMFVQYAARYGKPGDLSWLFFVGMDYHYGPFSSRNMMEQIRIRDLSGTGIPLDGDMLHYDETGAPIDRNSQTLLAAMKVFPATSRDLIFKAFLLEKDRRYIYTDLHRAIAQAHRERFGETPFAVIGELMMGEEAWVKHGSVWKTRAYLDKLDRYLNSLPWDSDRVN